MTSGYLPHRLEIPGFGRHHTDVEHHRFHDHRADGRIGLECSLEGGGIVERNHGHQVDVSLRDTGAVGDGVGMLPRSHLGRVGRHRDHHRVVMTVIRAFDLDDAISIREGPSEANGVERRLGAGVGEPHLGEPEPTRQLLCHPQRGLARSGKVSTTARRLTDRIGDHGVGMTHHHHPEAVVEVGVLVAVDVPHLRTLAVGDVHGMRRLVLERRGHPAGKHVARPIEQLPRLGGATGETLQHLFGQFGDAVPVHRLITTCLLIV